VISLTPGPGEDFMGLSNSTIKQWTDSFDSTRATNYRVDETSQDITILTTSVDERPQYTGAGDESKIVQTFTVQYRKPFAGTDLYDVDLIPEQEFNLTSAYGCYVKDGDLEGVDGDTLNNGAFDTSYELIKVKESSFIGCASHWQTIKGQLIYTDYSVPKDDADNELTTSLG